MEAPDELALVVKALTTGLDGCVEWDDAVIDRIRHEMLPLELTPEIIKAAAIEFAQGGGAIRQVREQRPQWKNRRDYYYKIIIPMLKLFKKGLFVEMEIANSDNEYPEIRLVNAHEQK
jgi:hypothetical protein